MIQILQDSVTFGPIEDVGPRTTFQDVTFSGSISQAAALLTGFDVRFSGGDDHNLGQVDINLQASILPGSSGTVRVNVTYGLRDAGDFDDRYEGIIRFAVIAE